MLIIKKYLSSGNNVADLSSISSEQAAATSAPQDPVVEVEEKVKLEVAKPGVTMHLMLFLACLQRHPWLIAGKDVFEEVFLSGNMQRTQDFILRWSYFNKNRPADAVLPRPFHWLAPLVPLFMSLVLCADVVFRGIAQVYLCNHPISGILVCIGLAHESTQLLVFGLMGTACATLMCWLICVPNPSEVLSGLCG
jgi:hypothetical protein